MGTVLSLEQVFQTMKTFRENLLSRNNHNAQKLIEKYSNLAREALSSGDKILSENYFQHADHFTRILNDQENYKKSKYSENASTKPDQSIENNKEVENFSEKEKDNPEKLQTEAN